MRIKDKIKLATDTQKIKRTGYVNQYRNCVRQLLKQHLKKDVFQEYMRDFYEESLLDDLNFLTLDETAKKQFLDAELSEWMQTPS